MQEEILSNGNDKIIKKYRKVTSSNYPPRSSSDGISLKKPAFMRDASKFA